MWRERSVQGPTAIREESLKGLEPKEARPVVLDTLLKLFLGDCRCSSSCPRCGPNVEC